MKQLRGNSVTLESAIAALKQFAGINARARTPHAAELSVHNGKLLVIRESLLKKTLRCVAAFFSRDLRLRHMKGKRQVQQMMLNAIDTVKRNHLIISKLQNGSPEEQQFASATLEAIKSYNSTLDNIQRRAPRFSTRMERFFYKYSGFSLDQELIDNRIDLPTNLSVSFEADAETIEEPLINTNATESMPTPRDEADLIRMKANTLLKQHGFCFKTMSDAFTSVKAAPIHTAVNLQSQTSTLCLTLNVLPGTTIKVQGSFKRSAQTYSAPITDSFRLSVKSVHSGYPHPSQHNGWALAESFIPLYPYRLDLMPLFKPLYERKQQAALGLLPDGKLLDRAKKLIESKRVAFNAYRHILVPLHHQLSHTILSTGPVSSSQNCAAIDAFFSALGTHADPWERLTEAYDSLKEHFLVPMHAQLQQAWIEHQQPDLHSSNPAIALEAAQSIITKASKVNYEGDPAFKGFVMSLGPALNAAANGITLQHWSEALRCAPPLLHDFELKVQSAAYAQLSRFLDEIESEEHFPDEGTLCAQMQAQLLEDIALFQAPFHKTDNGYTAIVHELEEYFGSRYLGTTYGLKD